MSRLRTGGCAESAGTGAVAAKTGAGLTVAASSTFDLVRFAATTSSGCDRVAPGRQIRVPVRCL